MNPSLLRVIGAVALCLASVPVSAQDSNVAPAPPAVPVGQVDGAPISAAAGQTIEGMATVIDGDELRVGDRLVRLFGIAAPEISANYGPDARLYLDGLAGGQRVRCKEVDRTENNESIAICSIDGTDLAPELLAQGLAAVYRIGASSTLAERELAARYDLEESDSRARKLGLWAPHNAAPKDATPPPAHPLSNWRDAVPKWIEQAPLLALLASLGLIGLALLARRPHASAADDPVDDGALTAALLAEVSAIQDSAQEQYDGTAALLQDAPIPASQQGMLGLPRATVFSANADRIDLLPGELAAKLVRFYALHDSVAHLLQQAGAIRCDTIRASLHGLTQSADQALAAG